VTACRSRPQPALGAAGLLTRCAGGLFGAGAEVLALAALAPLAAAVVGSFDSSASGSGYAYWWASPRGWESLGRTLAVAAAAGTIALALAWLLAASAAGLTPRWAAPAALAACLPMLVPSSLLAAAWIAALGREGTVAAFLRDSLGLRLNLYGIAGAAWVTALRYFGLAALLLCWSRLRREGGWPAARAARLPRWAAALHLGLRADARPALAAWLLVVLFSMNDHIIPGMLLVSTCGTQVLIQYSALLDPGGAAALAAPMAALGAGLAALAVGAGRTAWTDAPQAAAAGPPPRSLPARAACAACAAAVLALALAVPAAVLAARTESPAAVLAALADAREQAWRTVGVAAAAAALAAAGGAALAHRWAAGRRAGALTAAPAAILLLAAPPSLPGIGMITLFQHGPLAAARDTSWPLVLGLALRLLPVAMLLLYALWRREPAEGVLAARVHGVPAHLAAWRVVWPPRRAAVAAAALLAAILAATDLETAILLAPPGGSTLGVRLYTLIHTAPEAMTSALALGILLFTAPAVTALAALAALSRGRKAGRP